MTVDDARRLQRALERRAQAELRLRSAAGNEALVEAGIAYIEAARELAATLQDLGDGVLERR